MKKVSYYLDFEMLPFTQKDATAYPGFAALQDTLYQSAQLFLNDVMWSGHFGDLFTSRTIYANEAMAAAYGLPAVTGTALQAITTTGDAYGAGSPGKFYRSARVGFTPIFPPLHPRSLHRRLRVASSSAKSSKAPRCKPISVIFGPSSALGRCPAQRAPLIGEIPFPTPLSVVDWKTGKSEQIGALVRVRTRPSVLYGHLFAALGEFVQGVESILLFVGIFFAIIELIALIIGTRMTRTVTAAVAQLHAPPSMWIAATSAIAFR